MRWWVVIASAALVALAGCSTGDDAVAQGGTFEFVAPGGQTDIFYDPPEDRGKVWMINMGHGGFRMLNIPDFYSLNNFTYRE